MEWNSDELLWSEISSTHGNMYRKWNEKKQNTSNN